MADTQVMYDRPGKWTYEDYGALLVQRQDELIACNEKLIERNTEVLALCAENKRIVDESDAYRRIGISRIEELTATVVDSAAEIVELHARIAALQAENAALLQICEAARVRKALPN